MNEEELATLTISELWYAQLFYDEGSLEYNEIQRRINELKQQQREAENE